MLHIKMTESIRRRHSGLFSFAERRDNLVPVSLEDVGGAVMA